MLLNTGTTRQTSQNQLLSTVAWTIGKETHYALEGSVFIGGAAVAWLRDGLGLIEDSYEIEELARTVPDSGGVVFVPAFNGLGTPHWDQDARGLMIGLTRGTTRGHIARATLEAIALQVTDLVKAMERDSGLELRELRVDGGAASNSLLLQIQSDLLQAKVSKPKNTETTALGAALLAGLGVGLYPDLEFLSCIGETEKVYEPQKTLADMESLTSFWNKAVERSKAWEES